MNFGIILLCFISFTNAASISRSKRQYVVAPLYSSCNEYLSCAAPAVCMAGTCQCTKSFQPYGATCIAAAAAAAPVEAVPLQAQSGLYHVPAGVAPATYRAVYTDAAQPVRLMNAQPVVYYQQVVRAPTVVCAAAPCPVETVTAPVPVAPTPGPEVTTQANEDATTPRRLYDGPSIAYPGDSCLAQNIICVGGSFCVSGTCVCRDGEVIENQQCVVVTTTTNAPTTASSTTTTTTTTTMAPTTTSTIATTEEPTTTTTEEPTTTPTTTTTTTTTEPTTTTTTTTVAPTTTTLMVTEPETTTTTTTTEASTTTIPSTTPFVPTTIIGRDDQGCSTPNCNCNSNGCMQQQIIRINFMVPGQTCASNSQCRLGSYCASGTCKCASSFEQRGTTCVRRR